MILVDKTVLQVNFSKEKLGTGFLMNCDRYT